MSTSISLEPIPMSDHHKISSSILTTCKYIIDTHYPYVDDACELFLIQAQAIARYCDWTRYRSVLQYCSFAERCQPSSIQTQRLIKLQNLAYGYKLKKSVENYGVILAQTWIGFHSLLTTLKFYFPGVMYTEAELTAMYRKTELGVVYDEITGEPLHRDLTPYITSESRIPHPDYVHSGLGSRTGNWHAEFAEEVGQDLPMKGLHPHWV